MRLAESRLHASCMVAVEPRGLRSNREELREAAGSAEVGKAPQMAGFSNRKGDRKSETQSQQGRFFCGLPLWFMAGQRPLPLCASGHPSVRDCVLTSPYKDHGHRCLKGPGPALMTSV